VPPKLYGGTERVVHYITEKLVDMGHDVTLFASGDSETSAQLVPGVKEALRLNPTCIDPFPHHVVQLEDVITRQSDFDVIHFHTDYFHFPLSSRMSVPCVTTLHGRLDIPDLQPIFNRFPNQPVISISNSQRIPLPQANWLDTVYHGLPADLHSPGNGQGNYLAFMGRISPEKGVDKAIEIAISSGNRLQIAAKVDKVDEEYYNTNIKHLLDHPLIEYIGEINEDQKTSFLGNASALLFPINWCEPFGLVLIEAMSCGTPVIAFDCGSVSEVIENGKSGFIVNSVEEGVTAINRLSEIPRTIVRKTFDERFTSERMVKDYLRLYESVIRMEHGADYGFQQKVNYGNISSAVN
jgi:glycosyltransferase involved in cell wall biosynthesis